jgi:hypothetical protein
MANRVLAGMFLLLSTMFCVAVAVAIARTRRKRGDC